METEYHGIDYGLGRSNVDLATGIRFGVINQQYLASWIYEEFQLNYVANCPKTGNQLPDTYEEYSTCPYCSGEHDSDDMYGEEPDSQTYSQDGIEAFIDSSGDIWVTKSPYYAHVQFCSPCAPGAGYLKSPCKDGPMTYCLPAEWFEANHFPMPYLPLLVSEIPE